jgi:hypothetical protein
LRNLIENQKNRRLNGQARDDEEHIFKNKKCVLEEIFGHCQRKSKVDLQL